MTRKKNRSNDEMRPLEIQVGVNKHAEGSALVKFGDTHVICTASIENNVPRWMREVQMKVGLLQNMECYLDQHTSE